VAARLWEMGYPRFLLRIPALPLGRASPPPQLCGPMSASVGLRGRVEGRFAAPPNLRQVALRLP
jgi:hypothetical protein